MMNEELTVEGVTADLEAAMTSMDCFLWKSCSAYLPVFKAMVGGQSARFIVELSGGQGKDPLPSLNLLTKFCNNAGNTSIHLSLLVAWPFYFFGNHQF